MPTRTTVVDGDLRVPYADLWRQARSYAAALQAVGVKPGDAPAACNPAPPPTTTSPGATPGVSLTMPADYTGTCIPLQQSPAAAHEVASSTVTCNDPPPPPT